MTDKLWKLQYLWNWGVATLSLAAQRPVGQHPCETCFVLFLSQGLMDYLLLEAKQGFLIYFSVVVVVVRLKTFLSCSLKDTDALFLKAFGQLCELCLVSTKSFRSGLTCNPDSLKSWHQGNTVTYFSCTSARFTGSLSILAGGEKILACVVFHVFLCFKQI